MKRFFVLAGLLVTSLYAGESRVGPVHLLYGQQSSDLVGLPKQPKVEWYQVIVGTDTPGITAFRVSLVYEEDGVPKLATLAAPVLPGFKYAWFYFGGKYKVVRIQVEEMRPEPLLAIEVSQ